MRKHRGEPVGQVAIADGHALLPAQQWHPQGSNVYLSSLAPATYTSARVTS